MKFEEIVKKGKSILENKGLVEVTKGFENLNQNSSVPGIGGVGDNISFERNRRALEKYAVKVRLLGNHFIPDTTSELFNQSLSMPVLSAPMSGIKTNLNNAIDERDFQKSILKGCSDSGVIGMCGDSFDIAKSYFIPSLIKNNYGNGIAVCKPRSLDEILSRIKMLGDSGTKAIGIDIDGIGGVLLSDKGFVTRKNKEELIQIRKSFKGQMFLKGVMSTEDAKIAYQAGFDAIVVSNHGGRVMGYTHGVADVLPEISKKYKGKMTILADGGIRNGYDVFMYLALGADGVLVGRTLLYSVLGDGHKGVATVLEKMKTELARAMLFTNCRSISDINSKLITRYE